MAPVPDVSTAAAFLIYAGVAAIALGAFAAVADLLTRKERRRG